MGSIIEFEAFSSPAYRLESPNSSCSVMRNMFPERVEQGPRAGKLRLRQVPGLPTFGTLPDSPMRGLLSIDGGNRLFAVAGGTVYEVFSDGTYLALTGSVALSSHPAIMAANGFQIMIASGGLGYIASGGPPGSVAPINFTDGSPLRAASCDFIDQYFIAAEINSKRVFVSDLAPDGAIWNVGNVAIKEGYADNIARVFCDNEQVWLFGFETIEPWSNTAQRFPFGRVNNTVIKFGCSAPYSVAGARGFRFWLFNNAVYGASGVDPERISDYGVERAIETYGNVSDAEGWAYIKGGHIFYVLSFPGVQKTWVYDASIKAWHERGLWAGGQYGLYRGRVYARAFNKDLVGDPFTGAIYEMDPATCTDAGGAVLRRQRTCPYITESMRMLRFNQLTIDQDTGVGLDVAEDQPGYEPQVIMKYSDNRGETYSNERQTTMGKVGDNKVRVIFNQMGSSRIGKTFDLVVTDPVQWNPNTAYLNIGGPLAGR